MIENHVSTQLAQEEEIYRQHAAGVFTYLLRHVPVYQDAEDLLVEVFLAVLEKLPQLDLDQRRVGAYVQGIARNKVADYYRQRGKHQVLSLDAVAESAFEPDEQAPEQLALAGERFASLQTAFAALPPQQQTIVRLRFLHGLRSAEIATKLARSENSVRVTLSRALKFLRTQNSSHDEGGKA